MVGWRRLNPQDGGAGWTALLTRADDATPFQSAAWGAYKRRLGWEPEQWVACDGHGQPVCGFQILKKRLPLNRVLVWVPGGPVLGFPARGGEPVGPLLASWLEQFRREHALAYVRFDSRQRDAADLTDSLRQVCRRPAVRINSGYTIQFDLTASRDALVSAMTSKHRYYVKQAQAAGLDWQSGQSEALAGDFLRLHRELARLKGMRRGGLTDERLTMVRECFGDQCRIVVGYHGGQPVTACVVLTVAQRAWYFSAATGAQGRRISAAYAMVPILLDLLNQAGVTRFDFGGINPRSPSAGGVDHFKRGFGGELIAYLGEWEWAASGALRWAANVLIGAKQAAW